jgi:hypothetical protein
LIGQFEGAALQRSRRGEDIEGRRMIDGTRRSAGVTHEGGEFGDEGTQAVSGRSVFGEVRVDFLKRGRRALGRCDRITRCLGGLILIGEQQWAPRFDQISIR